MTTLNDLKDLNSSQINKMNKTELQSTLKNILSELSQQETIQGEVQVEGNKETVVSLLRQILDEIKRSNAENEMMKKEMKEMKEHTGFLIAAVCQQQKFLESLDAEKRALNLIITGIPETDLMINNVAYKNDKEKVKQVLHKIGHNNIDVEVARLGKIPDDPSKKRPLKVVLKQKDIRKQILQDAKKLKDSGETFKNIYINKDTHPAIRKEFLRMRNVVKTESAKPENEGRLVEYDHKSRTVTIDNVIIDRYNPNFF